MPSGCMCDVFGLITVAGFDRCERWATLCGPLWQVRSHNGSFG